MTSRALIWFRRDLRVHDHPALAAAFEAHDEVIPLFVYDQRLTYGRWRSPNRTWFLHESLTSLDAALRERDGYLVVRAGKPEDLVPSLAIELDAAAVYVSRDYTPFGRRRDGSVKRTLARDGIAFRKFPGVLATEPESVHTDDGSPYRVYSPFKRRWDTVDLREPLPAPRRVPVPAGLQSDPLPHADPSANRPLPAGETAARQRLEAFIRTGLAPYAKRRDRPDVEGTSRLSADLRWGLLSPIEVLARTSSTGEGAAKFRSELAWREFLAHLLFHFPALQRQPLQPQFDELPYRDDPVALDTWKAGATGYPVVDAGMRQLVATGWMHNRVRMLTASFLTKDLLVDWRLGEDFFMQHLFDGDPASNNGGWQWAASTGADAQPYFRIFNPVLQGKKFDPDGKFVREWVPELRRVPPSYVHEPWRMPRELQEAAGCVVGRDYPAPILDHFEARERTLEAYARAGGQPQR